MMRRLVKQRCKRGFGIGHRVGVELCMPLAGAALARGRAQIEQSSAPDRTPGRGIAQDEAIAAGRCNRALQHELHPPLAARRDRGIAEQHDACTNLHGRVMEPYWHPL